MTLFILFGLLSVLVALVVGYLMVLHRRPELKPWHTAELSAEFRSGDLRNVPDLNAYLAREDELFQQLQEEVYDQIDDEDRRVFNRFSSGSLADPAVLATNWNRTFILPAPSPRGGVLLLHGLSDAPYSLRALGQTLHRDGFYVIGLRLPGHGTAPVGLTRARVEDFSAATRIAAVSLRESVGTNAPLFIVGYSNGATLAVDYVLSQLEGELLPRVDGLVLISPAIGITPGAAVAAWLRRLSRLPGMKKAAWQSVGLEYEPYKYNSFAVNASEQIHRLTTRLYQRIQRLDRGTGVAGFPPVLAFQSVVDATVVPTAVIDQFLRRLAPDGHELVLFDIQRGADVRALMVSHPETFTETLTRDATTPFAVTAVTSDSVEPRAARVLHRVAGTGEIESQPLSLQWPPGVFSLSHVALPFPPDDPVYGNGSGALTNQIALGHLEVRGEGGVLAISPRVLLRLRYNPFYSYLEQRVCQFGEALVR